MKNWNMKVNIYIIKNGMEKDMMKMVILINVNGKVKEYYKDEKLIFIFKGEYVNGSRNGKGKEYYENGKLIFEGEYLNGQRNGKGKDYNFKGKLRFEGEYLNRKRNGKGREYNKYGLLVNVDKNKKCQIF